eukprot:scaffold185001_cov32-Tisochrysis_lutea.AAC.1
MDDFVGRNVMSIGKDRGHRPARVHVYREGVCGAALKVGAPGGAVYCGEGMRQEEVGHANWALVCGHEGGPPSDEFSQSTDPADDGGRLEKGREPRGLARG